MGIDFNEQKLLCLVVLDDRYAKRMSSKAGPAFWRAFILENRETHEVTAEFRFRYEDDERNWFRLSPATEGGVQAAALKLCATIVAVQKLGLQVFGLTEKEADGAIECFWPPDDEGDFARTLIWLEQRNLIEIEIRPHSTESDDGGITESDR